MSDGGEPRLVPKTSEAERERARANRSVEAALRQLTANLLRVVRGAGKPYEIVRETDALVNALVAYRDAVSHWPTSDEFSAMLSVSERGEWRADLPDDQWERLRGMEQVVAGNAGRCIPAAGAADPRAPG